MMTRKNWKNEVEPLRLNMQFFASSDEEGTGEPDSDLGSFEGEDADTKVEEGSDSGDTPSVEELLEQLTTLKANHEAELKRRKSAEKVIEHEKRERRKAERANMTEAEQLEAQRLEIEEKARQYDVQSNRLSVQQIFLDGEIAKDDFEPLMDYLVTEDADKSKSAAEEVVGLINRITETKLKAQKEAYMRENPTPPGGGSAEEDDFASAFKSEGGQYR